MSGDGSHQTKSIKHRKRKNQTQNTHAVQRQEDRTER